MAETHSVQEMALEKQPTLNLGLIPHQGLFSLSMFEKHLGGFKSFVY